MQPMPVPPDDTRFGFDEGFALELDRLDPLAVCRNEFHLPRKEGAEVVYFAGNSLGLQPKKVRKVLCEELDAWADRGVEGHFEGQRAWYSYHELLRETGARLAGAIPGEVVAMNSLTVNLHLMMVSFYRPTRERFKILIEEPCFPSDMYAVCSQIRYHGLNPKEALVVVRPRAGEHCIHVEDIEELLRGEGERVALIFLSGVNFVTGQVLPMAEIVRLGHRYGCTVGLDLAHAAGNVPLELHDWGVDFAVWCNYKYLNSGPGAVGGCFVHEKHFAEASLPRFAGWWGNDPRTRFRMHLQPEFVPVASSEGWQISNPPIFSLAPVKVSYDLFNQVGMPALREKSIRLTGYLRRLLEPMTSRGALEVMTPSDPNQRGCQLSFRIPQRADDVLQKLRSAGVVCDFRPPDVLRAAPTPLYNSFHEAWRFSRTLAQLLTQDCSTFDK